MCLTTTIIPGNTCPGPEHHTLDDILYSMNSSGNSICPYFNDGSFTAYATETIYSWSACGEEEGAGGGYDNGGDPYSGGSNEGTGGSSSDNDNSENTDLNQSEDIEDTENPVNTTPVTTRGNTPCEEISKIIEKPQFSINMLELKNNINGTKEKGFIIRDMQKLEAFKNDYVSWSVQKTEKYMDETFQNPDQYNIKYNSTHDEQVTGFLRFIQDQDIGLELYEGDVNNFTNWRKLNLVDNGNGNFSFYEEPCNN